MKTIVMLTLITSALCRPAVVPTAFFHGTHDNCDNNRFLTEVLSKDLEAPVECIEIGNGIENSINTPVATLAIMACETLMSDPTFQVDEINVIGFSMGGLIARFIAQDCPIRGKVRNMITVGTPNMGITGIPACGSADIYEGNQDFESYMKAIGCRILNFAAKQITYHEAIQDLSAIGYVRDADDLDTYLEKSNFLAKLNNEVIHPQNLDYRKKVISLNSAIFIMWDSDEVLYPRETSFFDQLSPSNGKLKHSKNKLHYHYGRGGELGYSEISPTRMEESKSETLFEFQKPFEQPRQMRGSRSKLVKMVQSDWYLDDNLGFKTLNEANRIKFLHMPGGHDKFSIEEAQTMFVPALNL